MVRQNNLKVSQRSRRERQKDLLVCLIGLLFISYTATSQEVPIPESLKTYPKAKCYWSYSVERLKTTKDSVHQYIIRVQLQQQDSVGNDKGRLRLKQAFIYCYYSDKDISNEIHFKQKGLLWIANINVSTNQPLPISIVANYYQHRRIMPLTLNEGTYPGEPDN